MSLLLMRCATCGHTVFPARIRCPACGGSGWTGQPCERGRIAQQTVVRTRVGAEVGAAGDIVLCSVVTDAGPVVIARIAPERWGGRPVGPGTDVALAMDSENRIDALPIDASNGSNPR